MEAKPIFCKWYLGRVNLLFFAIEAGDFLYLVKKTDPGQSTVFCRLPRVLFLKKISFQTSLFSYKDFDTAKSQVLLP